MPPRLLVKKSQTKQNITDFLGGRPCLILPCTQVDCGLELLAPVPDVALRSVGADSRGAQIKVTVWEKKVKWPSVNRKGDLSTVSLIP